MNENQHWVSVWGNAVSVAENRPERYAKDITIRYPIHIPFGGTAVKLTFDNYCGTEPVTLNKTTVFYGGAFYKVAFGGENAVTIPAGEKAVSDPLTVKLNEGEVIQVSFYLKDFTLMRSVVYACGPLSEGLYANGDETENPHIDICTSRKTHLFYFLSNVSVLTDAENRSSSATATPSPLRTGPTTWPCGASGRGITRLPSSAGPPPVPGFCGNTTA